MKDLPKRAVIASMVMAGIVGLMAIADLTVKVPFSGSEHSFLMDILFIVCAAIVGYLAWDTFKDMN